MSDTTLTQLGAPARRIGPRSARDVVEEFAGALACSALDRLELLLDEDVVVRTPGRSALAGDHRGRAAAMAALSAAPVDQVRLSGTRVTEILVDGSRGLVVLEMAGSQGTTEFCFEVAFHLVVERERVVAVTEYSADQYTADRLVGAGPDIADPADVGTRGDARSVRLGRRRR